MFCIRGNSLVESFTFFIVYAFYIPQVFPCFTISSITILLYFECSNGFMLVFGFQRNFIFKFCEIVTKLPCLLQTAVSRGSSTTRLFMLVTTISYTQKELYFKVSMPLTPSLHVITVSLRLRKSFNFNHPPLSRHSATKFFPIIVALLRRTLLSVLFSISFYCLCLQIYLYHVFKVHSLVRGCQWVFVVLSDGTSTPLRILCKSHLDMNEA